ncbi:unnamed protein product [Clonostachys byssicola]|uniref:Zn(2)-C6 fungal-type domain-containing protein n=1 Tax=Clonostachys byssicola TaxID=160290 RepID=A0A9N9UXA5_9HYPO|nr:unnamed protein product [Clonostachys byssicola]
MDRPSASDAGAGDPAHPRKRRRKTFSGCWTCRAKHVKCDEAKPACMRCERAGVRCEGYGIRLSWTFLQDPSNFRPGKSPLRGHPNRQTNDVGPNTAQSATSSASPSNSNSTPSAQTLDVPNPVPQAHNHSSDADAQNWGSDGPLPQVAGRHTRDDQAIVTTPIGQATSIRDQQNPEPASLPSPGEVPSQWDNTGGSSAASPWNAPQQSIQDGVLARVEQSATIHSTELPYNDISWLPNCHRSASPDLAQVDRPGLRHLDTLPDPARQCKLLEHWTLLLCDLLAPVPGIHNPLRTIFMPLALEGAREDANNSTGSVALFHMICSACGFHLSRTETNPESRRIYGNLGLEHHNLGIAHLSQNIRSDDKNQHISILASLIMCLYTETITVHNPSWRLHIRGAVEWVNHTGLEFWHQTESASIIYQMFISMAILIQSQILPGDRSGYGWNLRYDLKSQPQPYMLESIYGISQPILQVIHAMNIIQQKAQQTAESPASTQTSDVLTFDLDRLELELLLMTPRKPPSSMSHENGQLMYHHGYTYYYAALIYLRRTMKAVPVEEVQGLVKQALEHIEALETVTPQICLPLLWPLAITAFEAQDSQQQQRMLRCIDFFGVNTRMAQWERFGSSVRGLWAQRQKTGDVNLSWHAYSPVFYQNYMLI